MANPAAVHKAQAFHLLGALTEAEIAAMGDATGAVAAQGGHTPPVDLRLPSPDGAGEQVSLVDALARRRTSRQSPDEPLTMDRLAEVLGHAARAQDDDRRPHPSALATYPLRLDVVALRCDDLPHGVHRYEPAAHGLRTISTGDHAAAIGTAFGREWVQRARVVLVISADLGRATGHADVRGYRYALLEAGHLAQNLLLLAAAAGLPACPLGGFADEVLAGVVQSTEDQAVLCAVVL